MALPSTQLPSDWQSNYTGPSAAVVGWQPSIEQYASNNSVGYTLPSNYVPPYSPPTIASGTGSVGLSSSINTGNSNMALPITTANNINTVTNPLATNQVGMASGAQAPNLGVTAGSAAGGGGLTQGTPLPNITTTQEQATATPQFYTDYLNQLAQQGATAAQGAQFVGPTGLQNAAFNQTAANVGNYLPSLQQAANLAGSVGDSNIVGALGNLNQSNIANNLAPQATAGIVGTGQFGSARGAGALGQVINQADIATQAQQAAGMQQDYANKLAASGQLGTIANQTQNLGLGDVNALGTMGAQQQQIAQNQQLFPMQQLTSEAGLLKGATIPTATSSSYTGPIPGAYNASPLSQIAGLGSLATGVSNLIPAINTALPSVNFSNPFSTTSPNLNPVSLPGGSGFTYALSDPTTKNALAAGATPVDDNGNPMPGWSQSTNGTWQYKPDSISSVGDFVGPIPPTDFVPPPVDTNIDYSNPNNMPTYDPNLP